MTLCAVDGGHCNCQPDEGIMCLAANDIRAELAAQYRELASLRAKVGMLEALSRCGCGDSFTEHDPGTCGNCLAGITSGASIDRKDAERYQWLRDTQAPGSDEIFDAAIDAAIERSK